MAKSQCRCLIRYILSMEVQLSSDKAKRDYQLVCMARERGDQQAYADLMRMYREPVYTMLLRMTRNPADADDLTIEAFGKAFCQLHQYNPTSAFSTWLFSIASNNCLDFIRKQRMQTVSISEMGNSGENEAYEFPLPSDSPNPEEAMMTNQSHQNIREVVKLLKPRYRELVELRYFEELTYDEIAQRTHIPLNTVKIRLMRAKNLLKEMITEQK